MREKLIELLETVVSPNELLCDGEVIVSTSRVADHLIANGVTFVTDNNVGGKWIPVTERLPDLELAEVKTDDNDLLPCLAAIKHPRAKNGKYTAKVWYDGYGFIDGDSIDVTYEITHWMPLPEPPKEDA